MRIDHLSTEAILLGVWQVSYKRACDPDSREMNCWLLTARFSPENRRQAQTMKNTKFVVKVNLGGTRAPQYVQRIDRAPIQTTTNRKLALVMGKFMAEDTIKSLQNSRRVPELISVQVEYGQPSV